MSPPQSQLPHRDGADAGFRSNGLGAVAQRAAVLCERRDYLHALRRSIVAAEHSIFILGWDVDPALELPDEQDDGFPPTLRELLVAVLRQRPRLSVFISAWDVSKVHAFAESRGSARGFAGAHPQLHYRTDLPHVPGAAHHEQLVVIDDGLAFAGSVDLTARRWPAHRGVHNGEAPIAQLCVQGDLVGPLSRLARERVLPRDHASPPAPSVSERLWPEGLAADFTDITAALARTRAAGDGQGELREALDAHLSAISGAQSYLYIETQYLSSAAIVEALCSALGKPSGPELVLILPNGGQGWLADQAMIDMRNDALRLLQANDTNQRLRVYRPRGSTPGEPLQSRLVIVDDWKIKVGSSNLSNRSMTLDNECDIWLEAETIEQRGAVRALLVRLLARHLETPQDALRATLEKTGSLAETIAAHDTNGALEPITAPVDDGRPTLSALLLDREQIATAAAFADYFASALPKRSPYRVALLATIGVLALGALAALLIWGSDPQSAIRSTLTALLERVQDPRVGLLYVLLAYGLGTLVCAPITAMFVATTLVLSPVQGFFYALLGGQFGATLAYLLGRTLGSRPLRRLSGPRLLKLRREVQTRSFRSVLIARFLPVGNFTLINVFLGSLKVPYWAFVAGNTVGMAPSLLGLTLLADQLQEAIEAPSVMSIGRLLAIGVLVVGAMFAVSRFFAKRRARREQEEANDLASGDPRPHESPSP